MSKRISIILLSVTVLLAVWVFVSMLVINPQGDEVEERLAGQVASRLAEDEDFLEGVSSKVEEEIPGYITAWTESDAFKAILNDIKARMVAETVAGLLDGPMLDVLSDAAIVRLGTAEGAIQQPALDKLTARVAGQIEASYLEAQVIGVLEENKDALVDSFLKGMISAYTGLPAEERAAQIEAPVLEVYGRNEALFADDVQALIEAARPDIEAEVLALYAKYGKALADEINAQHEIADEVQAIVDANALDVEELTASIIARHDITEEVQAMIEEARPDIEAEVLALYAKYGEALADEIISKHVITAEVQTMIDNSLLTIETEILELAEEYGEDPVTEVIAQRVIMDEVQAMIDAAAPDIEELTAYIIAQHDITGEVQAMIEEARPDIEAEVLALYAKYGEALADEIIAKHVITDEVQAIIDANALDVEALTASIIAQHDITEEVSAMIEEAKEEPVDIEAEVLALYEKYGETLAAEIIQAHEDLIDYEALVDEAADRLKEEILALLEAGESEEEAVEAVASKYGIAAPVFGEAVTEEAGTEEYNEYRAAYKAEALSSVLAIIGE